MESSSWPINRSKSNFLILGAAFLFLWILFRSFTPFPYLFPESGEPRLAGADSYFHLRHAEAVAADFPKLLRHDDMATFPKMERGVNQGLYDLLVAAISTLSFGLLSPKVILIWVSPIASGLAAFLIAWLLWSRVNPQSSILFLLFAMVFPGPLSRVAALGNGDHHAFEVLLATCLAWSLLEATDERGALWKSVLSSLILYAFYLSWAGAPLHLFFAGLCFYAVAFLPTENSKLRIWKGTLFGLCLLALCAATNALGPDYILWDRSHLVFIASSCALAVGYAPLVFLAQKLPPKGRLPVAILGLLSVLMLAQFHPSSAEALSALLSPRSSAIAEHSVIKPKLLFNWYGLSWLGLIFAPILLMRYEKAKSYLIPLLYGLGLVLFWAGTRDFAYYSPFLIAMAWAYCLSYLPWKVWSQVLVFSLLALSLLPGQKKSWLSSYEARQTVLYTKGLEQASTWLREVKESTPDSAYGLLAPWDLGNLLAYTSKTSVGWSQTHSSRLAEILYSTDPDDIYERLAAQRGFRFILIPSRNIEQKFGTELSLTGMNPSKVFAKGPKVEWKGREYQFPKPNELHNSMLLVRLFNGLASGLGHYRLVFESPQQVVRAIKIHDNLKKFEFSSLEISESEAKGLAEVLRLRNQVVETSRGLLVNPYLSADVRIFEFVPGALLVGRAGKHEAVHAYLKIKTPYNGKGYVVAWKAYADAEGEFQIRVPYPTDEEMYKLENTVEVMGAYKVRVGEQEFEASVTEAQVRAEAKVRLEQ